MKVYKTQDPQHKPSVVMLVYGNGGVGKTTFAATAPQPLLADCENGAKYFGLRGIKTTVAQIEKWADMKDFTDEVKKPEYETIVIDPLGELMEKLMRHMVAMKDNKLVQRDGTPTMAGWGWMKSTLRNYIKLLRDMGKHVIIIAHVEEKDDEGKIVKRPKVQTKLSEEVISMVDVVAYMTTAKDDVDGEPKRVLLVDADSDKYVAKDRTGQLGKIIEPDFSKIVKAIQGGEIYKWSAPTAKKIEEKKEEPKAEPVADKEMKEIEDSLKEPETTEEPKKLHNETLQKAKEKLLQSSKVKAQ